VDTSPNASLKISSPNQKGQKQVQKPFEIFFSFETTLTPLRFAASWYLEKSRGWKEGGWEEPYGAKIPT
jgi:hypothetical protein